MPTYTIAVPSTSLLRRICGTNDYNIKLIESVLGSPLYARGNELSLDYEEEVVAQKFKFIIERILDEFSESSTENDSNLIRSILNIQKDSSSYGSSSDKSLIETNSIIIPGAKYRVYPRTNAQAELVSLMRSCDIVFGVGPAGSGKTFIAVAEAMRALLCHEKKSIVLTRPVVEAGENLGFLPGDLDEKLNPYMKPLFDSMSYLLPNENIKRLIENGAIEAAPLAYMRGRTLSDSVIILDEAQNTTPLQMKMFLTRMGEGSKVFITGDISQIDLPRNVSSGLVHAIKILRDIPGIAIKKLSTCDIVRNPLVKKIVQAYENEE